MSKMIKEMEKLTFGDEYKNIPDAISWNRAVSTCIEIAKHYENKKHKKKKKGKCEWYEKNGYYNKHNEQVLFCTNFITQYKYCPYCGKKIKIKESDKNEL